MCPSSSPNQLGRLTLLFACLTSLPILEGCGDGKVKRYPVNCSVTVDGKPAAGVIVIFCPVDGPPEVMSQRPVGLTDAEGKFQLTTLVGPDGVPAGNYKVMAEWPASSAKQNAAPGAKIQMGSGPDQLHGKYFNLEKTPLTATIAPDTKELPTFALQTK
jgi:hypothetical protein